MRPVRPIITDFEEVVLPEDDLNKDSSEASVDDLSSAFNRLINSSVENQSDNSSNKESDVNEESNTGITPVEVDVLPPETDSSNTPSVPAESTSQPDLESVIIADLQDDGESPVTAESIFEAILFVGSSENDGFITSDSLCQLMPGVTEEDVASMAKKIAKRWQEDKRPYYIDSSRNGAWRIQLDPVFEPVRSGFYSSVREFELPQSAINVLGIVAYLQPISALEIGEKTHIAHPVPILNQLVKRNLLQVEKRITGDKKVNLYTTTDFFLEFFGLDSLEDLPTSDDV